jgi:membrane-associated phospholipid phosphatase
MKLRKEVFILLTGAAFLAASVLSFSQTQLNISLALNQYHHRVLDYLSFFATHLGDGIFAVLLSLVIWYYNKQMGIMVLLTYAISSGLTQLLKRLVFADLHRPLWHLERLANALYYLPPGAEQVYNHSFPSGHSTTAFAIFAMLSFFSSQTIIKVMMFVLALLVAFTRVYLLQHFLIDTLAGAFIGTTISYVFYFHLYQRSKLDVIFRLRFKKNDT